MESEYTYQIGRLFNNNRVTLSDQRWKALRKIDDWARSLHSEIDKHAGEYRNLVKSCFIEQERALGEKNQETLENMRQLYRQSEVDQIDKLLEQCNRVKFDLLVELTYEDKTISFIQCVSKDHPEQRKEYKSIVSKTENYTSTVQLEPKDSHSNSLNDSTSTTHPRLKDSHSNSVHDSTSTYELQTNQSTPTRKPTNTNDDSIGRSNNNQGDQITSNNNADDKCPICFMIFPLHMSIFDKERHVDGHYQ